LQVWCRCAMWRRVRWRAVRSASTMAMTGRDCRRN
jgi:hypothetical protein